MDFHEIVCSLNVFINKELKPHNICISLTKLFSLYIQIIIHAVKKNISISNYVYAILVQIEILHPFRRALVLLVIVIDFQVNGGQIARLLQ